MSHSKRFSSKASQLFGLLAAGLLSASAQAADTRTAAPAAPAAEPTPPKTNSLENVGDEAERVNIETIKQKYWARGNEDELGVVQNRMYTKEHKFEFGLYGGVVSTDPFLTVYSASFSLAYHYNE